MTDLSEHYLMDGSAPNERDRLGAIESTYDPGTLRHLSRLGLGPGSRVLVAGAGGGSLLPWLSEAVGDSGSVLATDIETQHLTATEQPANVTVLRHDFLTEEFPADTFDLVHARLILIHFPQREHILARLVRALRPGGRLLVEEYDWGSYGPVGSPGQNESARALIDKLAGFYRLHGFDPFVGRKLPGMLRRAGLVDVDAEGRVLTLRGATSSLAAIYLGSHVQFLARDDIGGLISAEETAGLLARMSDPDFDMTGQTMMAAWGRLPEGGDSA
ncbi:methyltransferase domain-containing protein [Streptomyces nodosus]|uniref:methyltransferase domain-containing protein n=1 Tax=Streptomyces nodosus TaxID=40318 RepID=UPI00380BE7C0